MSILNPEVNTLLAELREKIDACYSECREACNRLDEEFKYNIRERRRRCEEETYDLKRTYDYFLRVAAQAEMYKPIVMDMKPPSDGNV
jgi:hypothetical protein